MTMQEKIAAMQTKRQPRDNVFQKDDGTWGHCMSFHGGFADKITAETDFRFCMEWAA